MPLFSWKSEYSVNVDELDRHHQNFISIINTLYGTCFGHEAVDRVDQKIEELLAAVRAHFCIEEEFMRSSGYPEIDRHIREHQVFEGKIRELQQTLQDSQLELTKELITFLGGWLLNHILKQDKLYALPNVDRIAALESLPTA